MGNENVGQPQVSLQLLKQIQNLRLNRHIQCRHRLVTDNQLRVHCQGTGNADSLTPSPVQLVRIHIHVPVCQAYGAHQLQCALLNITLGFQKLVLCDGLADELHHRLSRIQGRKRILEHHLHLLAQRAHLLAGITGNILAVK